MFLVGCKSTYHKGYSANGKQEYNKKHIVDNYHGILNTGLYTFPDQILSSEDNTSYHAYVTNELIDDRTTIFLDCVYDVEAFNKEIQRIKSISVTITFNDNYFTNHIKYDTSSYNYPAYIAIDGFSGNYEYALIKEQKHEIIYLYFETVASKQIKDYSEYMKKDTTVYKNTSTTKSFTIYNHTFDNGQSWVEFDDDWSN